MSEDGDDSDRSLCQHDRWTRFGTLFAQPESEGRYHEDDWSECADTRATDTDPGYLYISNGGRATCADHGGVYLTTALTTYPHLTEITTPLEVWERVTIEDAKDGGISCEGCDE
jgi:hypothetical protein